MTESLMPPTSSGDNLETRSVRLSPGAWRDLEEIAQTNGEKLSEVYRRAMMAGISAERQRLVSDVEYANKRLIQRRLAAKEAGAIEALDILVNDKATAEQRLAAVALIQTWLGKG